MTQLLFVTRDTGETVGLFPLIEALLKHDISVAVLVRASDLEALCCER